MPPDAGAEQEQDAGLERLLTKIEPLLAKGDSAALVSLVKEYGHDNADLRARNRELNRELKAAQGKVKDGDLILTGEDAKTWALLGKLQVPVKDLPARLTAAEQALKENADYKRDNVAEEAAAALNWNPRVLKGLVRLNQLTLEKQTTKTEDGEKAVQFVIPGPTEEDDPIPLTEYVEQHLGDFRDALAGAEAARKSDREAPTPGRQHVRQQSGDLGRGKGVTDAQLDEELRQRHSFRV
jgi:hypothetical protein